MLSEIARAMAYIVGICVLAGATGESQD